VLSQRTAQYQHHTISAATEMAVSCYMVVTQACLSNLCECPETTISAAQARISTACRLVVAPPNQWCRGERILRYSLVLRAFTCATSKFPKIAISAAHVRGSAERSLVVASTGQLAAEMVVLRYMMAWQSPMLRSLSIPTYSHLIGAGASFR